MSDPVAPAKGLGAALGAAATSAMAAKTAEKLYEGLIEGAMEVGVRDGLPALIKYVRGKKSFKPEDEKSLEEAYNLFKEGKKSEAIAHARAHLGHLFSEFSLEDEFIFRGDGYRAVRHGHITHKQRIEILKTLGTLPHKVRRDLRYVQTADPDPDVRAEQFGALKDMKREDLIAEARGLGLTDPHPLDTMGRAAKIAGAKLDREFADMKSEWNKPQEKGFWARFKRIFLG